MNGVRGGRVGKTWLGLRPRALSRWPPGAREGLSRERWTLGTPLAGAVRVEDGLQVGRLVEMRRPSLLGVPFSQDSRLLGDAHSISVPIPMSKLLGHPQHQAPEAETPAGSGVGSEAWEESTLQEEHSRWGWRGRQSGHRKLAKIRLSQETPATDKWTFV